MKIPHAPDGRFEGALLFDGCDYRTADGIVDFAHSPGKLGLVRQKKEFFRAEFLTIQRSQSLSMPVWDESRDRVICSSAEEAKRLAEDFVVTSHEE